MKFSDIFRIKDIVEERDQLKAANAELTALTESLKSKYRETVMECNMLRANHVDDDKKAYMEINKQIEAKKIELEKLMTSCQDAADNALRLTQIIAASEERLVYLDDLKEAETYGMFTPQYKFGNLRSYKTKLSEIRREQKAMIKNGTATNSGKLPVLNDSENAGMRLLISVQTLALRSFNIECDSVIGTVTPETYESARKRIKLAAESVNKLCRVVSASLNEAYVELKYRELVLMCEYQSRRAQKASK